MSIRALAIGLFISYLFFFPPVIISNGCVGFPCVQNNHTSFPSVLPLSLTLISLKREQKSASEKAGTQQTKTATQNNRLTIHLTICTSDTKPVSVVLDLPLVSGSLVAETVFVLYYLILLRMTCVSICLQLDTSHLVQSL